MDLLNVVIRADTAGAERSTAALDKMTAGARQADAAIASLGSRSAGGMTKVAQASDLAAAANQRLAASARGTSLNTANIAAQFQDIGVTAAMGMNPLMIALQQGTQLSAVFASSGQNLGKMLGAAFLSIVSPVSIATIAIVAIGASLLQAADWTGMAQAALQGLASGLEVIGPYAAVAAAGLALFYSPAIITGIVGVVAMLGTLAAQAIITGAAMLAANPVGAIVLGLAIAATALVVFRDEIAKVLGFDIVQYAQDGANWIIGAFVGAFNAIKLTWALLPAAIGDLVMQAVNNTIGGVESMINFVGAKINDFIKSINDAIMMVPEQFRMGWSGLGEVGEVKFDRAPNPYAGNAGEVSGIAGQAFKDAQGFNYVGEGIAFVQDAASGAADALRGMAGGMGAAKDEAKGAADAADAANANFKNLAEMACPN